MARCGLARRAEQRACKTSYWINYTSAHGLGNSWVNGIAALTGDKLYFATNGGGLTYFDGATRKTYTTSNSAIPSDYVSAVAIDKQKRVWIGTTNAGVARLENDQWTKFSLANNYINALAIDSAGNVWVATSDGAFFFDGKAWTRYTASAGLASHRVNAIAIAPDNQVWFGTDNGVSVFDGKTFRSFTQADGLAG